MSKKQYVYTINDLPDTLIVEDQKIYTKFLLGENTLVSFIEVPPGADFPLHSHDCEQILIILEGEEHHIIDGEEIILRAGDVCVHPPNVIHGGHPGPNGYRGIDIFVAPRESHIELMKAQGTMPDEFGKYKVK